MKTRTSQRDVNPFEGAILPADEVLRKSAQKSHLSYWITKPNKDSGPLEQKRAFLGHSIRGINIGCFLIKGTDLFQSVFGIIR